MDKIAKAFIRITVILMLSIPVVIELKGTYEFIEINTDVDDVPEYVKGHEYDYLINPMTKEVEPKSWIKFVKFPTLIIVALLLIPGGLTWTLVMFGEDKIQEEQEERERRRR